MADPDTNTPGATPARAAATEGQAGGGQGQPDKAGGKPGFKDFATLLSGQAAPTSAQDPLFFMREVLKDPDLSDEFKYMLFYMSQTRFTNRRKMAYFSLYAILAFFAFLAVGAVVDATAGTAIMDAVDENSSLFTWIGGFLTGIVAFYYGASTIRPNS